MTAAIVLAAGAAARFGRAKQLADVGGEVMVARACRVALEAGLSPVIVVCGARADDVLEAVAALDVRCVKNERWADGLSSSIRRGVDAVATAAPGEPAAILLADQPLVDSVHIIALLEARASAGTLISATEGDGRRGAPAVFDARMFDDLRALEGDRGAGSLLATATSIAWVANDRAMTDVDSPEDLESLER